MPGTGPVVSRCRIAALQRLAHGFPVCLSFEAWLMSPPAPVLPNPTVRSTACTAVTTSSGYGRTVSARPAGVFLPRQRLQVRALVGQRAAIGLGLPGHELRAGRHLGVGL